MVRRNKSKMREQKMTGYPSIDKPWMKAYRTEPVMDIFEYDNIYDMLFLNRDMDEIVITYLQGICNWNRKKLKETTNKYINAFAKQGIQKGDNILCGVVTTPEFVSVFIALVSIGAVVKLFDIRANEDEITIYAKSSKCKYAIVLDTMVMDKMYHIIDSTELEKVYVMRPSNSLSKREMLSCLSKPKNIKDTKNPVIPKDYRFMELSKIIKSESNVIVKMEKLDLERICVKVQSSGTTGKAKTIVHSEKSMVEFAKSVTYVDTSLGKGKTVLVALPPWIAYGIGNAIINPLILGAKISICSDFEADAVYRNIGGFSMAYAAPFHYRYIRDHYSEMSEFQKENLRKVDSLVTGGDKYSFDENKSDEELFGTIVVNGYGNNECWGCISVNPVAANKYGSVGVPKFGDVVLIYDDENDCELKYNKIGEVCVSTKTMFVKYENNSIATNDILKKHDDGNVYMHTGDYGYVDEDGYLFITGRKERVIVRLGFKLSSYTIEDAICKMDEIAECIAVEVPDIEEEHVPMVFVVPSERCNKERTELEKIILQHCNNILKENEIPKYILIVDKLDYTANNKYDFKKYELLGAEYVDSMNEQ